MTASIIIILNIILLEVLLSVDNAAVLAAMVQDLPKDQRSKALKYGIWGAIILRGTALLFASLLIKILWLKILGGIYLCWLAVKFFTKATDGQEQDTIQKESNGIFRMLKNSIGMFWAVVAMVELMDLVFSIDNIFACVAFTSNYTLICIGVFIGILAMRFVAQGFVRLLEKIPALERTAFIVIGLLGLKLVASGIFDYIPGNPVSGILNSHGTDIAFSLLILTLFFIPVLFIKKTAA